jgi:hypothetical protein
MNFSTKDRGSIWFGCPDLAKAEIRKVFSVHNNKAGSI